MTVDLDDPAALAAGDPAGMLLALAGAGAQAREAATLTAAAGLLDLVADGRPRAVLVCGSGPAAVAAELFAAVAGTACPVPVLGHSGHGLPAWAGVADLVVALCHEGDGEQALSALSEAVRRGCRLMVVAPAGSPLAELGERGRAVAVPLPPGRPGRAALWSLTAPLVVTGAALGLLPAGPADVEEAATTLEQVAVRCRPDADVAMNPAKTLAHELDGTLPLVWAASPLTAAAAHRFAGQLAALAGVPVLSGAFPDDAQQVAMLTGSWAPGPRSDDDVFRDREDEPDRPALHVVLLRDRDEHPTAAGQAAAAGEAARERSIGVAALASEGRSPLARLASLVGLTDFASCYLALLAGADPGEDRAGVAPNGRHTVSR